MRWKHLGVLCLILIGLAGMATTPVEAHALPVRTVPDANATLTRDPTRVEIYFSEAVDPTFSKISILDANGIRVDAGDVTLDPADNTHLTVTMRSVGDGVFTVVYTALSATDGHQTTGSFPFAVGNGNAAALANAPKASGSSSLTASEVISKGLLYLVFAALTGGILFSLLVWNPSLRQTGIAAERIVGYERNARRLAFAAVILLIALDLVSILVQAGLAVRQEILPPWDNRVGTILFTTRFGSLAIARLGLAFAAAGLILPPQNRWNRYVALIPCLFLALTFSLESHAADDPSPLLPILGDLLHLAAVSVWVGGLYHFLTGIWAARPLPPDDRTRLTAHLIPHFSNLALISVAGLALTGVYSAVLRVGSLQGLINTSYGQALIVKSLLVLPLIGMGAVNLLYTTPHMRQAALEPGGSPGLVARFRKLVTGEVILGSIIMLWVGLFVALPPAQVNTAPPGFNQTTNAADLRVTLNITPARVGVNTFTAKITSGGEPVADAQEVNLEFYTVSNKVPASTAKMVGTGDGTYKLTGSYLSIPDQWDIQVVTVRPDKFDVYANYRIDLNSNASSGAAVPWNQIDAGLIIFAGIAYLLAYRAWDANRWRWLGLGMGPAALLILAGILVFTNAPAGVKAEEVNPISPSEASVADGKALYQQNCFVCHGPTGKGDGPMGLTLNPRPADLTYHAQPGVHTDGQLFDWITNGFPGSVMPPFGQKLTDRQRWDLVNFIRTLAPHT